MGKYGNIPIQFEVLKKFIALELSFPMENFGSMKKKYCNMEKKYCIIPKTMEFRFTMGRTMVILKKNYDTLLNYC